jgi:hypothetical protein
MSTQEPGGPQQEPGAQAEPTEEELRAAYEAELSRITVSDMIAQALVSLLNIGAFRVAPAAATGEEGAPQRDLDQARDAIDAAMGLLGILERSIPQDVRPLRDALSQLQMAYAREVQGAPGQTPGTPGQAGTGEAGPGPECSGRRDRGLSGPRPVQRSSVGSGELRSPGLPFGGGHDRLRPRLHRNCAHAERSGRQTCARYILARHANHTAEDFS